MIQSRNLIYNFRINSDQICKNWLKARNSYFLSSEDAHKYQHIIILLNEMLKLMKSVTIIIENHYLKKLEIFEQVRAIVAQKLEIEPEQVNFGADFVKDLGVDSLDMLEIITLLEKAFHIEIPQQIAETFITIKQVIDFLVSRDDKNSCGVTSTPNPRL